MLCMRTTIKRRVRTRSAWLAMSILVGLASKMPAQAPSSGPATLLEIQIQNNVTYWDDVADPSKLTSSPGIAASAVRNFMRGLREDSRRSVQRSVPQPRAN